MKEYINELLHINEMNNKLVDIDSGSDASSTLYVVDDKMDTITRRMLNVISKKIGKPGNTVLVGSSLIPEKEQTIGINFNSFDWKNRDGFKDTRGLYNYIDGVYKEYVKKGNNPFFLSIGALIWDVAVKDGIAKIKTPFMLFPVRLVRTNEMTPVCIEFVDDDIYINPCLIAKLEDRYGLDFVKRIPLSDNCLIDFDHPLELNEHILDGSYFDDVEKFIYNASINNKGGHFEFEKNTICIASYNHDEICMYYDIKNHYDDIYRDELVNRIFKKTVPEPTVEIKEKPEFILENDTNQENIIGRIINGENMVIKGPPGTGKTVSIANMVASLMNAGKNVLVTSKKLAALQEVYDKMPENLRKYMLLLDSETEAKAASLTAKKIKESLNEERTAARNYKVDASLKNDKANAIAVKNSTLRQISDYTRVVFGDTTYKAFERSLYELLDDYLVDEEIPVVSFDDEKLLNNLTNGEFGMMTSDAQKIGKYYSELTNNYNISLYKSPLYGISSSTDINELFDLFNKIKENNQTFKELQNDLISDCNYNIQNLKINNLVYLQNNILKEKDYNICYDSIDIIEKNYEKLATLYVDAKKQSVKNYKFINEKYVLDKESEKYLSKLDGALTFKTITELNNNKKLFRSVSGYRDNAFVKEVKEYFNEIELHNKKADEYFDKFHNVFRKDLSEADLECLKGVCADLEGISEDQEKITGLFAIKAKKAEAKAREFIFIPETSFKELNVAIKDFGRASIELEEARLLKNKIYKSFQQQLSSDELMAVKAAVDFVTGFNVSISDMFSGLEKHFDLIKESFGKVFEESSARTIKELLDYASLNSIIYDIKTILDKIFTEGYNEGKALDYVVAIVAFREMYNVIGKTLPRDEFINLVLTLSKLSDKLGASLKVREVDKVLKHIRNDMKVYNYYTLNNITFGDIDTLLENAYNDHRIGSAIAISDKCRSDISFNDFTNKFDKLSIDDRIKGYDKVFKKSLLNVGINKIIEVIGNAKYSLCKDNAENISKLGPLNQKIRKANSKIIEENICSRIDPEDIDFKFLEKTNDSTPTRFIFRDHAQAIIKLKRCIIASPSSVSLLMRQFPQNVFDVAIVDEASQLEPVTVIPIAYRSKRIVIVGDEWQMPPIDHFKIKNSSIISDYDQVLKPEQSVLSLVLRSEGFAVGNLESHYRSETESLIKFSKERFYKEHMNTFPATVPMKEGLGFVDVYVEGATCASGVNRKEANLALELINRHFDKYMKNGVLTESLGVVAFGEKQIAEIKKLVEHDKNLQSRIDEARRNKGENVTDDKVIFFRTIEKVQGQEADHLILSFTYGVNENGEPVNRFGELNRDELGQCIFNVAVTRAKKSITIIHSIKAEQIKEENAKITYIKDYLKIVDFFSKGGKDQFLSKEPEPGFLKTVGKFLENIGVSKDRIVYNYGVTDGSIRIPIAILSKDYREAECGLWVEAELNTKKYNYIDYNTTFFDTLVNKNHWKMMRIAILEWYSNNDAIKQSLTKFIKENINL